MSDIAYVNEESAAAARKVEEGLLGLPKDFGILMVDVKPVPVIGGEVKDFNVTIGLDRQFDPLLGTVIVQKFVAESSSAMSINATVKVFTGIAAIPVTVSFSG